MMTPITKYFFYLQSTHSAVTSVRANQCAPIRLKNALQEAEGLPSVCSALGAVCVCS